MELGNLISVLYAEFLDRYRDETLAAVMTAAVVNDVLYEQSRAASIFERFEHAEHDPLVARLLNAA